MSDALTAPSPTAAPTRRVDQLLAHYETSHRHPTNELIHFIAIPVIMLSLIGLIFTIHPWLAYAFMGASMVYYARLSTVFLATMAVISVLMFALIHAMGASVFKISLALFVVAWIFRFIGHKVEGKKPSFFEDIQYLWVGPLFVLSKLFLKLGIKW